MENYIGKNFTVTPISAGNSLLPKCRLVGIRNRMFHFIDQVSLAQAGYLIS